MKKTLFLVVLLFVVSCSNPMNRKYNEETLKEDLKTIMDEKEMSETDAKLFAGWLIKSKFTNESLEGKTYQEILDEAKNFKKQQEELAKKAKKEEEARKAKMKTAITISMYGKNYIPKNYNSGIYSDYTNFKYAIENKTDKEIKAIKISFRVYNALGDQIGDGFNMDFTNDRIAPHAIYKGNASYEVNEFINDDLKLANAKFSDLSFDFNVQKIVYSDGSILE